MKAKIKATLITIAIFALIILTGFVVYAYPDSAIVVLIGCSAIVTVVATWKIVYNLIDKD